MSLSGTRGVFSLRQIYNQQRKGTGYPISDVFVQSPPSPTNDIGYIGGGDSLSAVDKLNFTDETTARVPTANLPNNQGRGAPVAGLSAGYFAGGNPGAGLTTIQKLEYSTDTSTVISPQLTAARYAVDGTARSTDGYMVGGGISPASSNIRSIVERFTFSNETVERIPGMDLQSPRMGMAVGGNQTQGYVIGGFTTGVNPVTDASKLTYASDTSAAAPSANIPGSARSGLAQSGNSTHGYFAGSNIADVYKTVYSTDTTTTLPSPEALSASMQYGAATGNTTKTYLANGFPSLSNVNRITASNDTTARIPGMDRSNTGVGIMGVSAKEYGNPSVGNPNPKQQFTTGLTGGPNAGYYGGGTPGTISDIQKSDFSTDTTSTLTSTLTQARGYLGQGSDTSNGYFVGGILSSTRFSIVDRFAYSTESVSTLPSSGQISAARYGTTGASSPSNAYIAGGFQPGSISFINKINFTTNESSVGPNISQNRGYMGSITNLNDIFYLGGWQGSASLSVVDKLVTSDDTLARAPGLNLPIPIHGIAGCGDSDKGYARGGFDAASVTNTQKITYSTETVSLVPGAMMEWNSHNHADSGNISNGYTAGDNGGSNKSISQLNYASETSSVSQYLPLAKGGMGGIGARNFGRTQPLLSTPTPQTFPVPVPDAAPPITGYVTSGETSSGNVSYSQKLNMTSDAYSIVPSMNLTTTSNGSSESYRTYTSSASSPTHGYLMNGYAPNHSNATKVAYVTETFSAIPGNTSEARRSGTQGGGNSSRGYVSGGWSEAISPNGNVSNTDKLIYATETFGRQPSANLTETRGFMGSVCNQSRMLIICGQSGPSSKSIVDRIDFASDSLDRLPGANDPTPRQATRTNYFPSPERGYSSGGRDSPSNTNYSLTTRLNFSDNTSSAVPGANMTTVRYTQQCTGNTTHTYQSGGATPSKVSSTDKLNMSTETFGAAPSANLAAPTEAGAGHGVYMNGNPSANVPQAPNPTPNYC